MCLKPITIENPNYNNPLKDTDYGILHNCVDSHLAVPCGHCSVCIALRQSYAVQKMQMESMDNLLFVGMVSYNNESLPSVNVNGYRIRYADGADISNMMRHIRLNNELPSFRYMAVSEFGGKKHRPHWHFILSIPKSAVADQYGRIHLCDVETLRQKLWHTFLKYWRRNYGSRKYPDWRPLLTYKQKGSKCNYSLTWIDTLSGNVEDAAFYATKYATKYDDYTDRLKSALFYNCSESEFAEVWSKVRPRTQWSKGFGDPKNPRVRDYICDCIDKSLRSGEILPMFLSPTTGQSFPMSPYFQQKFMWRDAAIAFKLRQQLSERENPDYFDNLIQDKYLAIKKKQINSRSDDPYEFLLDDEWDLNINFINNCKQNGNIETDFGVADFTPDEW